jgi:hypothetical protein
MEPETSGSVARKIDHWITEAVGVDVKKKVIAINYVSPRIISHAYVKLAVSPFEELRTLTGTTSASCPQSISIWSLT